MTTLVALPRLVSWQLIECKGSDGRMRRQMLKYSDDMRQDAVMEQLFMVVNLLLAADPRTRTRQLRLRCYKVRVGLLRAPSAEVLWCCRHCNLVLHAVC